MRVASDRPCKNGGWFHPVGTTSRQTVQIRPEPIITQDFAGLMASWSANGLSAFASTLGVKSEALQSLGCVWADTYRAWAFPMRSGDGSVIGIRLRNDAGHKWAVKGSKQGLFCSSYPASETGFVCEGPTDTAAAISIGLWAVGRPSCLGGNEHLKTLFRIKGVRRAVLLADNDAPGIQGAERLSSEIGLPTALLVLPSKDVREFVKVGGTRTMVETILHDTIWRMPKSS